MSDTDPLGLRVTSHPALEARLREASREWGLGEHVEDIVRYALAGVAVHERPHREPPPLGASRVGGGPDLPDGVDAPTDPTGRPWVFLGQLNFVEPHQRFLPRTGLLSLFIGELLCVTAQNVIGLLTTVPASALRRHAYRRGQEFSDPDLIEPFRSRLLSFEPMVVLPRAQSVAYPKGTPIGEFLDGMQYGPRAQSYFELAREQDATHVMNSSPFVQHDRPETEASFNEGGTPEDWVNLITFGGDGIGLEGEITISMRREDLARGDFSRLHVSSERS
ncbi:MAG: DUF1963 domain-containing protein [Myxococcota bacterium]